MNLTNNAKLICQICKDEGLLWIDDGDFAELRRCGWCEHGRSHAISDLPLLTSLTGVKLLEDDDIPATGEIDLAERVGRVKA